MALTIKASPDNEYKTDAPGTYSLETSGKFCENNISIGTNRVTYEIDLELNRQVRWHLLCKLDHAVLQHIDDPNLIVSCCRVGEFEYEGYDSSICVVGNTAWGTAGGMPYYGMSSRANKGDEYVTSVGPVFVPANNRVEYPNLHESVTGNEIWMYSMPRVDSAGNYYIRGSDGYMHSGHYRLIFQW